RIGGGFGPPRFDANDLGAELVGDSGDNLVLHLEEVCDRLVEPLGPDVSRSLRFDKLHVDPHPAATPLDAAFEHVAPIAVAAEFARVERLAAVGEGGVAPDHERASHP